MEHALQLQYLKTKHDHRSINTLSFLYRKIKPLNDVFILDKTKLNLTQITNVVWNIRVDFYLSLFIFHHPCQKPILCE